MSRKIVNGPILVPGRPDPAWRAIPGFFKRGGSFLKSDRGIINLPVFLAPKVFSENAFFTSHLD